MRTAYKYLDEHLIVILGASVAVWALVYSIEPFEESLQGNVILPIAVIVACVYKASYFVLYIYERIGIYHSKRGQYGAAIRSVSVALFSVLLSFAVDYLYIDYLQSGAFENLTSQHILTRFVDLFYFSTVTLATLGYGDITPATYAAKLIVIVEVFTGFAIVVFLLSHVDKIPKVDLRRD